MKDKGFGKDKTQVHDHGKGKVIGLNKDLHHIINGEATNPTQVMNLVREPILRFINRVRLILLRNNKWKI